MLTPAGKTTARQVAVALKGISFDAVYSSPLKRATETAEIIVNELDTGDRPIPQYQPLELLLEIDLPLWEGLRRPEVKAKYPDEYQIWKQRPHELCMSTPQGEHFPVLALHKQAKQCWQKILTRHQDDTILVVAHNGINRCLISTALGIAPERYHCVQQSNCGITVLNFTGSLGDPVQLESMNLTAHTGEKIPKPRPDHHGPRLLLVRHGKQNGTASNNFRDKLIFP